MAETIQKRISFVVGNETTSQTIEYTTASAERTTVNVPAAKTGTLSTRTDDDTGVVAAQASHGFVTNNVVDLFWADGNRRGMTATVSSNDVTLDGGAGDNLPVVNTAVTLMVPTSVAVDIDGDEAHGVAVYGRRGGYVAYKLSNGTDIVVYELSGTDAADGWVDGDGGTNPLANAAVASITFSHGYSGGVAEMRSRVFYGTAP